MRASPSSGAPTTRRPTARCATTASSPRSSACASGSWTPFGAFRQFRVHSRFRFRTMGQLKPWTSIDAMKSERWIALALLSAVALTTPPRRSYCTLCATRRRMARSMSLGLARRASRDPFGSWYAMWTLFRAWWSLRRATECSRRQAGSLASNLSTWFKVPLEITRSGLGADQLRGVIKYRKGTITVEFDLSRPLFLD